MADYPINKGIGHSVEFKGLKAQYLFIFAGGLLVVFFLVVVLYMAGADQLVCIGLGLTLGSLLVWGTFHPRAIHAISSTEGKQTECSNIKRKKNEKYQKIKHP